VLVGGRSSRMGRDKALLPFHGGLLVESVAGAVRLAAGNVVLVGNPRPFGQFSCGCVPDIYPGEGPLGGILTALQHSTADWNLIVGCDMPGLTGYFLGKLLDAAREGDVDALLPAGPSHHLEPLCAVYHGRVRHALYAAFARGVRKITESLEGLRTAAFLVPDAACFENVNTPAEWARYAAE